MTLTSLWENVEFAGSGNGNLIQNSTIGRRVVRVLNLHRDKNSYGVGENRGEMGRSLVTLGKMATLQ